MMISSRHILTLILFLSIMNSTDEQLNNSSLDDLITNVTFTTNESISISNTYSTSSLILSTLLTNDTSPSDGLLSSSTPTMTRSRESVKSLVDRINAYRNQHILARIKQCDPNIKLDEICEMYSIDNQTNSLIHQSNVDFPTLDDLSDDLLDQSIIEELNQFCLSSNWCLGNISKNDIQLTKDALQQRGHIFCSLDQCQSRLTILIDSCPIISNVNVSTPTLKLSPMLCTLYADQLSWNSTECTEEIVYLLYLFYAFWPQFEKCVSDGCNSKCRILDNILTKLEEQCHGNASFLSRVPALAWSRSGDLKEICDERSSPRRPAFIHSMEKYLSSQKLWPRSYEKPIYTIVFIILVISLVISFSLCFCIKSKYRSNANNRRFADDYEYTRLHNPSFELGTSSDIPNDNSMPNESIDEESQLDSNDRFRSTERQRLLFIHS